MIINSPPGIPIIHRLSPCKFYYPPSIRSDPIREIYSLCLEINLNTFEITLQRNVVNDIQWGSRRRVRFKKEKKNGETKKEREREEIQFPRSYIEWQASWRTTPDLNN